MKLFRAGIGAIASIALIHPAMAADCISGKDAMALKTAAVQQQLMVAAFMCNSANDYNRFVRTYQPELRTSDATLKSYFVRTSGSEVAYDSYKSKVANASALSQSQDRGAFCNTTNGLFAAAFNGGTSLAAFVVEAPTPPGYRAACITGPEASLPLNVQVSDAGFR